MSPADWSGALVSDAALAWLPLMLDAAAKSVVLLAAVWVVIWMLRTRSAASRHLVWFLALASLPALGVLSALLPGWNVLPEWTALAIDAPGRIASESHAEAAAAPGLSPRKTAPEPEGWATPGDARSRPGGPLVAQFSPEADPEDFAAAMPAAVVRAAPEPAVSAAAPRRAWAWPAWCLLGWTLGTAAALLPLALAMLSLRRVERKACRVSAGPLVSLVAQLSAETGLRRRVRLLLSDCRAMPMQWGILRARVLLPDSAEQWPHDRQRVVLLHELGHVRRWDCLSQLVAHVVCAFFWVNPLVWVARRRMQLESEAACDDLTLGAGFKPSDYAEHVLRIASGLRTPAMTGCGAIAMARHGRLEGRLLAILDPKRDRRGISRWLAVALLAAIAVTVVPLAMLRAGPKPEQGAADDAAAPDSETDAERARAESFIGLLKEHRYEEAAGLFNSSLLEVLPAKTLGRTWDEFDRERRSGAFVGPISYEHQAFPNGSLLVVRCRWEKAVMVVRLAFDDENRIAGFWLARDPEGPTPANFRERGYLFGPAIERIANAYLTLEARVVGLDGQPVKKSSMTFWRALDDDSERDERCWNDPATGKTWRAIYGAATGDRMTQEQLSPGVYRITAIEGHSESTPVGLSEPVHLDGSEEHTVVTVRMTDGPTLTIRPIDADSREALPEVGVTLKREDDALPPGWSFRPQRDSDPLAIEHLPPGRYRLQASRTSRRPEDPQYELVDGPMEVEIKAGENREVTVPLKGRPLTEEDIDRRWPWTAEGKVTDAEGQPIEGVEVCAHCGMGTLFRTGIATSRADGTYTLRFAPGIHIYSEDKDKPAANLQAATITAHKPGLFEKNLNRQGGLVAGFRMPDEEENYWHAEPGKIVLPGKPYRLDFVMVPAATIRGQVTDDDGTPVPDASVSLSGHEMPPSCSVVKSGRTDAEGRFQFDDVPTGYAWQFHVSPGKGRPDVRTQPLSLKRADEYRIALRLQSGGPSEIELAQIASVTDSQGRELRGELVGDDPFARPPVGPELEAKAREILRKMAEANRSWLASPAADVQSYQYDFHLAGKEAQTCRVDPAKASAWLRQGISYYSAVQYLASKPDQAVFRMVEVGEDQITLVYRLNEAIRVSAGNGLLGTWKGFFSMGVREGKLTIDAKTLTPQEHTSGELRETFSQYVDLGGGRYLPLRIRISKMQLDWTFRVYEPGLWLFHASRSDDKRFKDGLVAWTDNVQVNGQPGRVMHEAEESQENVDAHETALGEGKPAESESLEKRLRLQFRYQNWADVLEWLADVAGLSLVVEEPPPGTFNYFDQREYTVAEAIELVNSVLATRGYGVVQRGRMLLVTKAVKEVDVDYAEAVAHVAQAEVERAQQANRLHPGSVTASEVTRLKLVYEVATLEVEKAEAKLAGNEKAVKEIEVRQAKAAADMAQAEVERAQQANRIHPGSVRESEITRLKLAYEVAALEVQKAEAKLAGNEKAVKETEVRQAKAAADAAQADVDRAQQANRVHPGSVSVSEVTRLKLAHELAVLEVQKTEAKLAGNEKAVKEIEVRQAKAAAEAANSEMKREREGESGGPGDVPAPDAPHSDASTSDAPTPDAASARTVSGRVVDQAGKPVAGAEVWLPLRWVSPGEWQTLHARADEKGRFSMEFPARCVTEGRFTALFWTVRAYAPGHSLGNASAYHAVFADQEAGDVEVVLGPAADTAFVVEDPDGRPLAGAVVEPFHFKGAAGYEIVPDPLREIVRGTTGPDGRAVLPGLPREGLSTVRITTGSFGIQQQPLDSLNPIPRETTIRLRPTGRVEGQVIADDPELARGLSVFLRTEKQEIELHPGQVWPTEGQTEAVSDADGRFVVPAIAVGELRVRAVFDERLPYRPRWPEGASVYEGRTTEVKIRIEPAVRVQTVVRVKETGQPVPEAEISFDCGHSRQGDTVAADVEGKAATYVLPGMVRMHAIKIPEDLMQLPDDRDEWHAVPEGVDRFELPPLELVRSHVISGKLLDQEGKPLPNARIRPWYGSHAGFGRSDEQGNLRISHVPADVDLDNIAFELDMERGQPRPRRAHVVQRDPFVLQVEPPLTDQTGTIIEGRVVDQVGQPVWGARVRFFERIQGQRELPLLDAWALGGVETDGDGGFRALLPLERGREYRVEIMPGERVENQLISGQSKWVEADEPTESFGQIVVERYWSLRGSVLDENGRPVAGARVSFDHEGKTLREVTGRDGRFALPGVFLSGNPRFHVTAEGYEEFDGCVFLPDDIDREDGGVQIKLKPRP